MCPSKEDLSTVIQGRVEDEPLVYGLHGKFDSYSRYLVLIFPLQLTTVVSGYAPVEIGDTFMVFYQGVGNYLRKGNEVELKGVFESRPGKDKERSFFSARMLFNLTWDFSFEYK